MRISVFGLGYVGTVSAACFASFGHSVIGVDVSETKVRLVMQGQPPFVEPDLAPMLLRARRAGLLTATSDWAGAVMESDVSFVCVGTPSSATGDIDLRAVENVCRQIGDAMRAKSSPHIVVIRSTVLPGTFRNVVVPVLENSSGKRAGEDFEVACNPEFLREGTAVADFFQPPKTVIGADTERARDIVRGLYGDLPGPMVETTPEVSEFIKYVDNPWHALKVAFANEIGNLCQSCGVDSRQVMDVFLQDLKLNISKAYLRPGFAFGGSCLPKDLRAITHLARSRNVETPVLRSILESNRKQIERAFSTIAALDRRRIGVLGCSFKKNSDDMRESPFVELIERLIGKGFLVSIFDHNVQLSAVLGANRDYINAKLPHIASILKDSAATVVDDAQVVLLTTLEPDYVAAAERLREDQVLIDFAGMPDARNTRAAYVGVNW
ncbi:UDP-glucose dehydrogenase family protein [Alsobacter sp. SYSU BS001988]